MHSAQGLLAGLTMHASDELVSTNLLLFTALTIREVESALVGHEPGDADPGDIWVRVAPFLSPLCD